MSYWYWCMQHSVWNSSGGRHSSKQDQWHWHDNLWIQLDQVPTILYHELPTTIVTLLTLSNFWYFNLYHPKSHTACSCSPHNVLHSPRSMRTRLRTILHLEAVSQHNKHTPIVIDTFPLLPEPINHDTLKENFHAWMFRYSFAPMNFCSLAEKCRRPNYLDQKPNIIITMITTYIAYETALIQEVGNYKV